MIVISKSLALNLLPESRWADAPLIGWRNLMTAETVTASEEDPDHPAVNLATPSTAQRWQGETTDQQVLEVSISTSEPVDYVAFARHNFGSTGVAVSVEVQAQSEGEWEAVAGPFLRAGDQPWIVRFPPRVLAGLRVLLQPGAAPPRIAVMHVGRLLVMNPGIMVGHAPLVFARQSRVTNGRSEAGEYLGRIVQSQQLGTSVQFGTMPAGWYRTHMEPFLRAAVERPFFFAWAPQTHPTEVGFAWLLNDPQPVIQRVDGSISLAMEMGGLAI